MGRDCHYSASVDRKMFHPRKSNFSVTIILKIVILVSVKKGSCDDPFNSTGVYYFGDIIDEYNCDHGKNSVNSRPIQCVMGDTADDIRWNDTLPECKCNHKLLFW